MSLGYAGGPPVSGVCWRAPGVVIMVGEECRIILSFPSGIGSNLGVWRVCGWGVKNELPDD